MIELVMDYELGQFRITFEDGETRLLPAPKSIKYEEYGGKPGEVSVTFPARRVKFSTVPRSDGHITTLSLASNE